MQKPVIVSGREFRPEVVSYLNQMAQQQPTPTGETMAREVCRLLAWYSPNGQPAVSSARVAVGKLQRCGVLIRPNPPAVATPAVGRKPHRLRRSGVPLPPLTEVPRRVDQVRGLHLCLLTGKEDPLHQVWNDLIIAQHPCGDAPLVGTQLRYLLGSEQGWLGAVGFGPAAFCLGSRDQWIGWSVPARTVHLREVLCLSRLLIRQEVRCRNLASKTLSLVMARVAGDWQERYGVRPLLVETYVDRERFTGVCLSAANWLRLGVSSGRGRLGPDKPVKSLKDVWVFSLHRQARQKLQEELPLPLAPQRLEDNLAQPGWWAGEMRGMDLGDHRLHQRAIHILKARWENPQASFYGSFEGWTPAKGAYAFIEHRHPGINLKSLLGPHRELTQGRLAAEPLALLVQDTTGLNYQGLKQTTGLGPLGEGKARGLWLHSLLAFRPDGVPLGVLDACCWARPERQNDLSPPERGRNAKSLDEKESFRWVEMFQTAAAAARRMPQTQLVVLADREGDLYELHDAAQIGPANLHVLVRAQHDRNLESHTKLWTFMAEQPLGQTRQLLVPRRRGQPSRIAEVQIRWASVSITAPAVGCKKSWPPVRLQAVWVYEPDPPKGIEPIEWMLLTDLPINSATEAWQMAEWYCRRWGIEEWHRVLKSGCGIEQREFKTAEHLQRVVAFDLIVGWRILACVKLARALPQLPATVLYSKDELRVLVAAEKKTSAINGCGTHPG